MKPVLGLYDPETLVSLSVRTLSRKKLPANVSFREPMSKLYRKMSTKKKTENGAGKGKNQGINGWSEQKKGGNHQGEAKSFQT